MPINPSDRAAGDTLWTAAARCIFRYGLHPGADDWLGDPLAIEQRYNALVSFRDDDNAARWLRDKRIGLQFLALERLWPALAPTLGLPEFDDATGAGYTGEELLGVLRRFRRWQADHAARWRLDAEMVATYGYPPGPLSYEAYVGLALNRDRAQCLGGAAAWRAQVAASGRAPAYFGLVDAIAPTLDHAVELAELIESNRAEAQACAERQGQT